MKVAHLATERYTNSLVSQTHAEDGYRVRSDELQSEPDVLSSAPRRATELTAGWSGRPGPGERMTQSVLGITSRWNVALLSVWFDTV